MLELVNSLRLERTKLVDNFWITVDELTSRTDKDVSKTLAAIKDYRLYIRSISGINLDLTDTTSSWIAITPELKDFMRNTSNSGLLRRNWL